MGEFIQNKQDLGKGIFKSWSQIDNLSNQLFSGINTDLADRSKQTKMKINLTYKVFLSDFFLCN